jgi:preprotein translocase subunit SecA
LATVVKVLILMLSTLSRLILGSSNARIIKRYERKVAAITAFEPQLEKLTDSNLQLKTVEFRERLAKGETVDQLLPEAFAVVREAARRTLGLRHFDVQMMGGMTLHDKSIAEMKTGEGKTLVADAGRLSQCAARQGRAYGDRQ